MSRCDLPMMNIRSIGGKHHLKTNKTSLDTSTKTELEEVITVPDSDSDNAVDVVACPAVHDIKREAQDELKVINFVAKMAKKVTPQQWPVEQSLPPLPVLLPRWNPPQKQDLSIEHKDLREGNEKTVIIDKRDIIQKDATAVKQEPVSPTNVKAAAIDSESDDLGCFVCGVVSSSHQSFKEHMLTVHGITRPYKCRHCDKTFGYPNVVKRHERIHTGERPFKCKFCPKAFQCGTNLMHHERLHTGARPFKCPICGKTFVQKGCAIKHAKVHDVVLEG